MSYRPIDERFWTDPKVRKLSVPEKFLFLYFITCPSAHYSGLYYIPLPALIFETGFDEKSARKGIDTLSIGYHVLFDFDNSIAFVVNMAKFQVLGEKQKRGVVSHFQRLQSTPLKLEFVKKYPDFIDLEKYPIDTLSIPYRYPTDTTETDPKTETETDSKTETKIITAKNAVKGSEKTVIPESLKTEQFLKTWETWNKHLKEKRKNPTSSALELQLRLCEGLGVEAAIKTIERSIQNNWQGLFPEKETNKKEEFDVMEALRKM